MGKDATDWKAALENDRHIAVFVIFNLAATAESDAHGQLIKRLLSEVNGRIPVIPIVDTSSYINREKDRFNERCNQWRCIFAQINCKPLFLNLLAPDSSDVQTALQNRLNDYE